MATIQELVKVTAGGLIVPRFVDIREAVTDRYKSVFGSDIDLSTSTADGVFVNDISLMINNIVQTMSIFYSNLDVDTATGRYLDTLCALSNVTRKGATRSKATLQVTNTGSSALSLATNTKFVDKAGSTWIYEGDTLSLTANTPVTIEVVSEDYGEVSAPAGWIVSTFETMALSVSQTSAAIIGTNAESDTSLRARRNRSLTGTGTTVLQSLVGSLLNISGIADVFVYNNDDDTTLTSKDGTSIGAHGTYVIIRQDANLTIPDKTIGTIIHEKMTPGIRTYQSAITADSKSYTYVTTVEGTSISEATSVVYWKKATPTHATITIAITAYDYFASSEIQTIGQKLITYLNGLHIGTELNSLQIAVQAMNSDPKFKGSATFGNVAVTLPSGTNADTYYDYSTIGTPTQSGSTWTFTLS